jgi:MFS family permease
VEAFGRVLRVPHVASLFGAALLGRMPYGIEGLATVFFVQQETGSFATAGAVSASAAVAAGLGLPVLGRFIDALGQTRVLLAAAVVHLVAGAALIALVAADAPTQLLCAVAVVSGFATPPLSPALRSLWPDVLGGDPQLLRSAMALDAISLEIAFIGGPLLTALLVTVASPGLALAFGYAFSTAGGLAFASLRPSRRWRGSGAGSFGIGPLSSPGLLVLLGTAMPLGLALGTLEVGLPAFGVAEGTSSAGAMAIAALALGSGIGGLVYGSRPATQLVPAYVAFAAMLPVGMALLALPGSVTAMLLLAPLAGAALAPLTAAANEIAGLVAPEGTVTEAYAWVVTATILGVAAGIAGSGAVVEAAGWREAILIGAGAAGAGAVVAFAGRRTLAVEQGFPSDRRA